MTFVLEFTKKPIRLPIFPFSSFRPLDVPVNFHFWAEVAWIADSADKTSLGYKFGMCCQFW